MIDLTMNEKVLEKTVQLAKNKNIVLPTFNEQKNPDQITENIKSRLKGVSLSDVHPVNLFRITWKNQPSEKSSGFGDVNFIEIPGELSGVKARIICLVGKYFPTGAHKVGATYGCLVPRLVTGQFDPAEQKAVWPSTGNFCRGGAYNSKLLACDSIAILPEGMSRERFEWLSKIAGEVIATPGCESNVKEIFDKCRELKNTRSDVVIFNQFDELANHLWHYDVTGSAAKEVLDNIMGSDDRFTGFISGSGSAGTLGAGDFLKEHFPMSKIAVGEALQCPTLLNNGFGDHRIEGIGDKHVPWIHNVRNTDMVIAVDDNRCMRLLRLFNEAPGRALLSEKGVGDKIITTLPLMGISGIGNFVSAVKFAKYYELGPADVVLTVCTDSVDMYRTRLTEMNENLGTYTRDQAIHDYAFALEGLTIDNMLELSYYQRKRIHNLKYYTWVEQQNKSPDELNAQWYDTDYWPGIHRQSGEIDKLINAFNEKTGSTTNA
jgi:cysteine synthase